MRVFYLLSVMHPRLQLDVISTDLKAVYHFFKYLSHVDLLSLKVLTAEISTISQIYWGQTAVLQ